MTMIRSCDAYVHTHHMHTLTHTHLPRHTHTHTHSVAEEKYQALRGTIYRNATTIPLNETGPLISLRVVARNTRDATNGTAFPRTTLLVHIPVEVSLADGVRRPLLVPTSVVVASGNVNCSHYEAIPQGLVSCCYRYTSLRNNYRRSKGQKHCYSGTSQCRHI